MKLKMFMDAMQAIENDRKLTKEIVVSALEEALIKAYRKHIEIPDALVRVDISEKTGAIKVFQERQVVENVEDDEMEISLEDAQRINKNYQLGDLVDEEVNIQEFGRAAVVLAKNVMKQKIREAEKQIVYEEYCDKVEEMITGTIETVEEKFCIVNIGKTLAMMPKNQQMPNEKYREGERIRVVIIEVNKETKGAQVLVSRADATLVKRLFEKEVPEIYQGIIEIKAIAREAGERTKMAVYSHNENIDPIGACIGPRGQRVQVVIDELHGEKIDIFEWSEDVSELIKNALSPAEVLGVIPSEEKKGGLLVIVPDHQLSRAIGKRGKNARLAVKLTGRKIDIKAESEVNEAGIDWRGIAAAQHEEFLRRQEEERIRRQEAEMRQIGELLEQLVAKTGRFRATNPFVPFRCRVDEACPHAGKTLQDLNFWHNTEATVVAIGRGEALFLSPGPYMTLKAGDVLYYLGADPCVDRVERLLAPQEALANADGV